MELTQNFIKVLATKDKVFSYISRKDRKLLVLFLLFIMLLIVLLSCLYYNNFISTSMVIGILINIPIYCIVGLYIFVQRKQIENIKQELEKSELHNKSLESFNNSMSGFRHDFSNIITALGGLIYAKDLDGLKRYYDNILIECNINNTLSTLNPNIINNPAIYNIVASKYHKAEELGITVNLQIFINFDNFNLDSYDFCRILGILLDNSIEASSMCDDKVITIDIRDIKPNRCQIVTIENTYANTDIDIKKLSQRGYTSKKKDTDSHGIGLYQVEKILRKHPNVVLETSADGTLFTQELVVKY